MRGDELKEECVKDWYTKCKLEKEQLLPTASGDATGRLLLELSPRSLKHAHSQVLQHPGSRLMSIRLTEWQKNPLLP